MWLILTADTLRGGNDHIKKAHGSAGLLLRCFWPIVNIPPQFWIDNDRLHHQQPAVKPEI